MLRLSACAKRISSYFSTNNHDPLTTKQKRLDENMLAILSYHYLSEIYLKIKFNNEKTELNTYIIPQLKLTKKSGYRNRHAYRAS